MHIIDLLLLQNFTYI